MKKQANCLRCLKYQEIGAKRHSQITGSLPSGSNVIIGPGTYILDDAWDVTSSNQVKLGIDLDKSIAIEGAGRASTILKFVDNLPVSDTSERIFSYSLLSFDYREGSASAGESTVAVRHMTLDANFQAFRRIKTFTDDDSRDATAPDYWSGSSAFLQENREDTAPEFIGQYGCETDTGLVWYAFGVTAGDWHLRPQGNPDVFVQDGRAGVTPEFIGQVGLEQDTDKVYYAHGISQGNWTEIEGLHPDTPNASQPGMVVPNERELRFTAANKATTIPDFVSQIGIETNTGNLYRASGLTGGDWAPAITYQFGAQTNDQKVYRSTGLAAGAWEIDEAAGQQSFTDKTAATPAALWQIGFDTDNEPDVYIGTALTLGSWRKVETHDASIGVGVLRSYARSTTIEQVDIINCGEFQRFTESFYFYIANNDPEARKGSALVRDVLFHNEAIDASGMLPQTLAPHPPPHFT
jgi:hypothetical protein